jgi:hypothetical protein
LISKVYNGSTTAIVTKQSGNGMTNNRLFIPQGTYFGGAQDNTTCTTNQYDKCTNSQLQQRLGRYQNTTAGSVNGFATISTMLSTLSQLKNDFTPTYEVINTNYMLWHDYADYAVIKLSIIFEILS